MALLRTQRIAAHVVAVANASETLYTCPTGFRAVVRSMQIANFGGASVTRVIVAVTPSGGTDIDRIFTQGIAVDEVVYWDHELVMDAGDVLLVISSAATVTLLVSGAVLSLPT